ncbi:MAG: hypothetical protein P8X55_04095 [Desulfosarcinaceae bacterium]
MSCCNGENGEQPTYQCQKYKINMCPDCLKCRDPHLYCKFRPSCVIHFLEKEQARENHG